MEDPQQTDFSGGMNMRDAVDLLAANEYVWGVNVRTRDKQITPVLAPIEDVLLPDGIKQGLFAFGNYLLLFSGGRAYWRIASSSTSWTQIADFQMSATATTFYVALVTGSSANFRRYRLDTEARVGFQAGGTALLTSNGTPAGLVVQDGVNQPWLIFSNLTARVTQRYDEWVLGTAQEYVPIGTQMIVVGVKLFVLALDGFTIYQSVSGRMLDFVVNVKTDGTAGGDASTTSLAVSTEQVFAIKAVALTTFAVVTSRTLWLVDLDLDNRIWGEPKYINNPIANFGTTNERSVIELLGDYMLIDVDGIRSINAVMNLKFKGQNSPFSAKVSALFKDRLQSPLDTAACTFNNYGIFSVFTTMGYGLLIYDSILQQWVSFDQHDCVRVKNFAVTNSSTSPTLWALTLTGRVFQLEAGAALQPVLMSRAFNDVNLDIEQQPKQFVVQIDNSTAGTLRVIPYCDSKRYPARTRTLRDTTPALLWPIEFPIDFSSTDRINKVGIPLINLPYVRQFQVILSWTGGGSLNGFRNNAQLDVSDIDQVQKASYAPVNNS